MLDRVIATGARAVASAAVIIALAGGVAAATASTSSSSDDLVQVDATTSLDIGTGVTPAFTCASRTFCLFHGPNLDGYHFSSTTDVYNGKWLSVTAAPFDFNLPWGSLHNNS